jgi:transmembrane protein TMEM260 (protein O-mannosyltransferase)
MPRRCWVVALALAVGAFALYRATLLPGVDFGDTGSLQVTVGLSLVTARNAYPLYFALGKAVMWASGTEQAHALNLASAVEAAVAIGLLVVVASEVSRSIAAGAAAALIFAVSYTFWSQSIIAEVYALHAVFVVLTLLLLLRWERSPTDRRLLAFFAVYALGFGNHLSMILLLPAYTVFLLATAPGGWRSMFAPRIVAMATACAVVGALQYAWNLRTYWFLPDPPHGVVDALVRFWFDVTKSDWRETMVLNVPQSQFTDHAAMYWFDLRQQFGFVLPLVAMAGLASVVALSVRRAVLLGLMFATNLAFAYTYNVGDAHVFYLPSHLMLALLVAPALALAGRLHPRGVAVAAALVAAYGGVRAHRDFPALDRSDDDRPARLLAALTNGLDDRRSILLTDLNWQVQNGLSYYSTVTHTEVAWARMPDVVLYAPALVADNAALGREVALTDRARAMVDAAYGPLLTVTRDPRVVVSPLSETTGRVAAGTRYVLCALGASRDPTVDRSELDRAVARLAGAAIALPPDDYVAVAGLAGQAPLLVAASDSPFDRRVDVGGVDVEIRMESWLRSDTIRRMGFGQVVAARHHTLIVERGLSFAAFDERGRAQTTAYAGNIFAPEARYLVRLAR